MKLEAQLLVRGARVWTHGAVRAGADAVACHDGRIVAVGPAAELEPLAGPSTRIVEAHGALLTPGLTDAHLHLVAWARAIDELDLAGAATCADVVQRVRRYVADHPGAGVIVGRGWDAAHWPEPPHHAALDAVAADRPVVLHGKDYHSLWLNGAALARCGIGRDTPDPEAGRIVRDATGAATGILLEHATRRAAALLDEARRQGDDAARLAAAIRRLHAFGVTGVHDFEGPEAMRLVRAAVGGAAPPLRVLAHLAHAGLDAALELGLASGVGDDTFRIGAVKLFADGTLGSRTAAMLAPYEGTQETGMDLVPPRELEALVARAFAGGLSIAVHAIGDRAVRSTLDAFEAARAWIPSLTLPPRLEHLQLVDPADVPRLRALGVAASMQPSHAVADAAIATERWGARVAASYPWRALLDAGALLAFGSDAPVEPPSVALGLVAAVTRVAPDGEPFVPGQCVTLDEALTAYTEGPARLAGAWPRLAAIAPGSHADLVVWNEPLDRIAPAALADAAPATTIVGGRVVWSASERGREAGSASTAAAPARHAGGIRAGAAQDATMAIAEAR